MYSRPIVIDIACGFLIFGQIVMFCRWKILFKTN